MKVYQELTLLPNAEVSVNFLWEKIYRQIHLALVELQGIEGKVSVGVSFPEYREESHLGNKLRLFAQEDVHLKRMYIKKWLSRLEDYVHVSSVRDVPATVTQYAVFKRKRPNKTLVNQAIRKAKREGITVEEAVVALGEYKRELLKEPFLMINSSSTRQRFPLFIEKKAVEQTVAAGCFTTYGVNSGLCAAVPDF